MKRAELYSLTGTYTFSVKAACSTCLSSKMVQYSSKVASHLVALKSVRRLVENLLEHSVDLAGCVALVSAWLNIDAGCGACLSPVARVLFTRLNHRFLFLRREKRGERAAAAMFGSL